VLEWYKGHLCICFKATPPLQQLLVEDAERYFKTPYIGNQGWVSLIADRGPNWRDVKRLVLESHRLVTQPRSRKGAKSVSMP